MKISNKKFTELWKFSESLSPKDTNDWIHGFTHSKKVEKNAIYIATHTPNTDITIVRLFSIFHDIKRQNDYSDYLHGARAALFLSQQNHNLFSISEKQLIILNYAVSLHSENLTSKNPTIGTCWDADRLDLKRFDKTLDLSLFSTKIGLQLAEQLNQEL